MAVYEDSESYTREESVNPSRISGLRRMAAEALNPTPEPAQNWNMPQPPPEAHEAFPMPPRPGIDLTTDGEMIQDASELKKSEATKVSDLSKYIKNSKSQPRTLELVMGQDYTQIIRSSQSYFDIYDEDDGEPIRRREGVIRTQTALKRIFDKGQNDVNTMTLNPVNCRFKAENKNTAIYVLEDPPAVRSLQFSLPFSEEIDRLKKQGRYEQYKAHIDEIMNNPGSYTQNGNKCETHTIDLQFPYFIYVIQIYNNASQEYGFKNLKVFARHAPLSSLSDPLYVLPLTNNDTGVCLGSLGNDKAFKPEDGIYTPQHTINNVLMSWWSNIFNTDLSARYEWYLNNGDTPYAGILAWHYFSMTDPMFIYSAKMRPSTQRLNRMINELYRSDRDCDDEYASISFSTLNNMIARSNKKKDSVKVDVMYGTNISINGEYIEIGDDVLLDGETFYLDSAAYDAFTGKQLYLIFESEDDEMVKWEWSENHSDYIHPIKKDVHGYSMTLMQHFKSPSSKEMNELDIHGTIIKVGDVIKVNMIGSSSYDRTPLFTKVGGFRTARDGKIEVKFLNGHYLLSGIEVESINMDLIEISPGLTLEKGNLYFITKRHNSDRSFNAYNYDGAFLSGSHLYGKFKRIDSDRDIDIKLNTIMTDSYQVIQPNSENILPMVRLGQYVKLERFYNYYVDPKHTWCKLPAINSSDKYVSNVSFISASSSANKQNYKFMFDMMIKADAFDLKGFDHDIHFEIGDEVVYCNWRRPESLLEIQTIVDFMSDDDCFSFVLRDEKGDEFAYPYVDYDDGYIDVGKIRKVRREMNGFKQGMRVKPIMPRMPQFLKSGSFQIEYFVETGGTPLIMFNNYCTQWFDTRFAERFELILETDKRYNRLKLTPFNEEKFIFQPGDLMSYKASGGVSETNKLTMLITAYNGAHFQIRTYRTKLNARHAAFNNRKTEMKRRYIPYGILNPRITQTNFNQNNNASRYATYWNSTFQCAPQGIYMQMPYEDRDPNFKTIEFKSVEERSISAAESVRAPYERSHEPEAIVDVEEITGEDGIFEDIF